MFAFSWQTKLIILGAAAMLAFGAGWKTRDAFCDAAAARLEVKNLRTALEAREAAAVQDQAKAADDAAKQAHLEGVVRDLESKVSAGECLGADDAERLRSLWN